MKTFLTAAMLIVGGLAAWRQAHAAVPRNGFLVALPSAVGSVLVDGPERSGVVDHIDCKMIDIDTTPLLVALATPDARGADVIMREAFPAGRPIAQLRVQAEKDPAGLCHYASANRDLPTTAAGRVVFFCDSITEEWRIAAPTLFREPVIDRGVSGQNTSQMLLQFQQDVIALHPTIVHFMSGINDLNTPVGTVLTRDNIASMVQLARAHGIKVVLASITPSTRFWAFPTLRPADEIRQLNAWLREFARNAGVTYVDYYEVLADRGGGLPSALTNDGLHPNSRGYALMTPIAERALARMQASR